MGKFEILRRVNDDYQFNLKAANGEIILTSQGYASKAGCQNGIESVRTNSQDDSNFDRNESSNGKPFFNLRAANGLIIGTSQMYASVAARDNGIESVKKNAPDAAIDDQTL
ncbi:YegP family protein [Flavobacterium salilacus subsp. salilacus]|uniref:YegP family protein n=1 Tax=Flavobacterium TaxID=237 RepID=UPI00107522BE|nr:MULTISPECIES: YegP family protein [Flavobacterium]KAF2515796.1 YegP family protein [Flavobacterium salilacus subsp. salilacus]MBE1615402.1 YegP family protein [Flavobacterium sp. SaA2.13]